MACGWQDLPSRSANAYRHSRKLIGTVAGQDVHGHGAAPERLKQQTEVLLYAAIA
jgi:hypothetical protein